MIAGTGARGDRYIRRRPAGGARRAIWRAAGARGKRKSGRAEGKVLEEGVCGQGSAPYKNRTCMQCSPIMQESKTLTFAHNCFRQSGHRERPRVKKMWERGATRGLLTFAKASLGDVLAHKSVSKTARSGRVSCTGMACSTKDERHSAESKTLRTTKS